VTLEDAIYKARLANEDKLAAGIQPIPVLDSDATARLAPFQRFCSEHGVRTHPCRVQTVCAFIRAEEKLGTGPHKIALCCEAIEVLHSHFGYANPVASGAVRAEFERMLKIEAPRSWSKHEQLMFATLPAEIRATISRREKERETVMRRAQNEAAEAKRQSGSAEKPATEPNKETKDVTETQ
jgi:hypothetical protein